MHVQYRTLTDAPLEGKRVLLRAGFDVPIEHDAVTDTTRIASMVPTMRFVLDHGAALVIVAHQDRPKGRVVPSMSQRPLVAVLQQLLDRPVLFASSCIGAETKRLADALQPGDVLLLENVRFEPGEEANDAAFARQLAELGDLYVNDAFANCHRTHASMVALATLLPSYAGLQLCDELTHLSGVIDDPRHPMTLVIGGAKIETKVPVLSSFLPCADHILLGGGIANTCLAARGHALGRSLFEQEYIAQAKTIFDQDHRSVLTLPSDLRVAVHPQDGDVQVRSVDGISSDEAAFDLGPNSISTYTSIIRGSSTIVWNGPLGYYESERFSVGSVALARAIAEATAAGATSILGGGDTIDLLRAHGIALSSFTFVSMGGGAMLAFISGKELPALRALSVAS